ncbi:MAG: hypothetical protein F9K47_15690, partial [Burkholderiales bacterium]
MKPLNPTPAFARGRDWTWAVLAWFAVTALAKMLLFTGTGLADTFVFLAFLASLYFASAMPMA